MGRRRGISALMAFGLAALGISAGTAPARAATVASVSVAPSMPSGLTVGQTGQAGSLSITNTSTGTTPQSYTISSIKLQPSCASSAAFPCSSTPVNNTDPGVFTLTGTPTGSTGCGAVTFTTTHNSDDTWTLTPSGTITLAAPSATTPCVISFTFTVLRVPSKDANAVAAGVQTEVIGQVMGTTTDSTAGTSIGSFETKVSPATPGIASTATSAPPGSPISDSATISGPGAASPGPTGTLTFSAFGPNNSTCGGSPAFTNTATVNGYGTYPSQAFTPSSGAGSTYRWIASYSGDPSFTAVTTSCGDTGETSVVQNQPTITSSATASVPLGGSISDQATLAGGNNPTGSITFSAFGPNNSTCGGPATFTSTKTVGSGNGSYTSDPFPATASGTYRWIASYGGDGNNAPKSGACGDSGETSIVQATPGLTTQASAPVPVGGGTIHDSATLTGGTSPGGTITFTLFGPNDASCSAASVFTSSATVTGNGTYTSTNFSPTAPGSYRWIASYGGDTNNAPKSGACNDPNESTLVQNQPTLSTAASASVPSGGTVTDTATLSGGASPTGTITFTLFGPNDTNCSTTPVTKTKTVTGNGSYTSDPITLINVGTYRWIARYGGDTNNGQASGACNDSNESVAITLATPTMTTQASGSVALGSQVHDTATLANGGMPTGTITYSLYGPNDATCANPAVFSTNTSVTGNGPYDSAAFTPTSPGTYRWIASYGGDSNNNPVSGACNDSNESVVVTKASPTISTTVSAASVNVGSTVHDTATLAMGSSPTGTISFSVFGPNNSTCTGVPAFTSAVAVNSGIGQSGNFAPGSAGTYRWIAAYSGDSNNSAVSGGCNDANESFTASGPGASVVPAITGPVTVGDTSDSGTLTITNTSNGAEATSTFAVTSIQIAPSCGASGFPCSSPDLNVFSFVNSPAATGDSGSACTGDTFTFSAPDSNGTSTVSAMNSLNQPVTVTLGAAGTATDHCTITFKVKVLKSPATDVDPNTAGTQTFQVAAVQGHTSDNAVGSGTGASETTINKASPTLATTASASVPVGGSISDIGALAGGAGPAPGPTGSVTFTLFGPNNATCSGSPIFTSTKPVNSGNANYPSDPFTTTAAGTYRWIASYSGDSNNTAVNGTCNGANESVDVTKAVTSIVTHASGAVTVGGSISDAATLSSGFSPTGTITFSVYGPGNATCSGSAAGTLTATVNGNSPPDYGSGNFTANAAGTYRWIAAYGGDANNTTATTACNDSNESVTVNKASPAIVTHASGSVAVGRTISDAATFSSGFRPTGAITFTVYGPDNATCSGPAAGTLTATVNGNSPPDYGSGNFTTTAAGTYRWIAAYGGDANNATAGTACNDSNESVVVTPAPFVRGVTPAQGSTTGGTIVTITGSDLGGATSVSFGSAAASAFTVIDDSTIQATAPAGTAGTVDVIVTAPAGTSATSSADRFTYVVPSAGSYQGMQPSRICDTRRAQPGVTVNQCNNGGNGASLGPGQSMNVEVCGAFGGPSACTLGAVTMNVTVTGASAPSYLTVYPAGSSRPVASTLNFTTGDTRANLATLKVGSNGQVTVFNAAGTVDVVIDLEGTTPSSGAFASSSPGLFHPLTPARVCDTRATQTGVVTNQCNANGAGASLGAGAAMSVQMTGQGGIPASGVSAVVFNLTVTNTTAASYMTAWPAANARPLASNLNWATGQTVPNRVIVPVGHNGQVNLFNGAGMTDVVVDVGGWYGDGTEGSPAGATFTGLVPSRICDTRPTQTGVVSTNQCNNAGQGAALGANQTMNVQVTGTGQPVPSGARAVVANVTATNTTAASYMTVWPSGASQPTASDLNWAAGQTVPNLVVVTLSSGGGISLYNNLGSTDVIVDVLGYYS